MGGKTHVEHAVIFPLHAVLGINGPLTQNSSTKLLAEDDTWPVSQGPGGVVLRVELHDGVCGPPALVNRPPVERSVSWDRAAVAVTRTLVA